MQVYDKILFVLGVLTMGSFTYCMGRWPHDVFYIMYKFLIPLNIWGYRYTVLKPMKKHYFLLDFCYYSAFSVVLFVGFFPKNEYLYRIASICAHGSLGVSVYAFTNQMVFHNYNDLVGVMLHTLPSVCMWNVKQITMPYEL